MAAALNVTLGLGTAAAAQRVMVRHLPVGTPVEVVLDGATVGTGTVDESGDVTLPFKLPEKDGKAELDANVFVDTCEKIRRIVIVEAARPAPPVGEGCERREITGLYWVRRVNTIVVDLAPANPTLLLISGSYTPPKPRSPEEEASGETIPHAPLPRGFVMFARRRAHLVSRRAEPCLRQRADLLGRFLALRLHVRRDLLDHAQLRRRGELPPSGEGQGVGW